MTPRPLATLTMNEDLLPFTPDDRSRFVNTLEHLAELLSVYACELNKGEHRTTARVVFFERLQGVGPALLVRTE